MYFKRQKNTGFTLIELLVVIAIIGMLSSIVLTSLNSSRAKSRDARRVSDIRQIANALELYYSDNRHYPPSNGTACGDTYWNFSEQSSECRQEFIPGLSRYLSPLPESLDGQPIGYTARLNGTPSDTPQAYKILVEGVETEEVTRANNNPLVRCPASCFEVSAESNWCRDSAQNGGEFPSTYAIFDGRFAACSF